MDEKTRETEQAGVLLDTWGTQTPCVEPWLDYPYADDRAPKWLLEFAKDYEHEYRLVLAEAYAFQRMENPEGWECVYTYPVGERECPMCDMGEHADGICELCEGDGMIYWGEEWIAALFREIPENNDDEG